MTNADISRLRAWVESTLGGRVVEWRQQGGRESGGRLAWFTTVDVNGQRIACYIRADRGLTADGRGATSRPAGPEQDTRLVQYFYRHTVREQALLAGGLGLGEHAAVSPITPGGEQ